MPILTLALKDLRLLLRDSRSAIILLLMPVILVMVLGLALGESFGQKPDDRLQISVVALDKGLPPRPGRTFPPKPWSEMVIDDLSATSPDAATGRTGIRVEVIDSLDTARELVAAGSGRRYSYSSPTSATAWIAVRSWPPPASHRSIRSAGMAFGWTGWG